MHVSDDLMIGPVVSGKVNSDGPSSMELGVGPMGRVYIFDVVPVALNLSGIAAAQAVAGAANLTLTTAATGVTYSTLPNGTPLLNLDVGRNVDILSSSASDTAVVITVYGYDMYGQAMSEAITTNGTARVAGKKAFKSVYRVASGGAAVGNISVGFGDVIGLPYRVTTRDYITFNYNATVGLLTAVTVADTTATATTTTGDVRGTITLATAANGTKRLVATIALPAIACGPNATRIGALGVTQA